MGCMGYGREYSPLRLEEPTTPPLDEDAQTRARTKSVTPSGQTELPYGRLAMRMIMNDSQRFVCPRANKKWAEGPKTLTRRP